MKNCIVLILKNQKNSLVVCHRSCLPMPSEMPPWQTSFSDRGRKGQKAGVAASALTQGQDGFKVPLVLLCFSLSAISNQCLPSLVNDAVSHHCICDWRLLKYSLRELGDGSVVRALAQA